jgi:zinc transporter
MVKNEPTFLHSCILDGTGGAKFVDASSVAGWTKDQGVLWVHLDVNDDASRLWLAEHGGLDSTIVESLLADETRPRSYSTDNGLLTVLRGVNTNPGEDSRFAGKRRWPGNLGRFPGGPHRPDGRPYW